MTISPRGAPEPSRLCEAELPTRDLPPRHLPAVPRGDRPQHQRRCAEEPDVGDQRPPDGDAGTAGFLALAAPKRARSATKARSAVAGPISVSVG